MRTLLTTTPGLGHLHPLLPFAHALRDAGHEVAFAGVGGLRDVVSAAGFRFFCAERGAAIEERAIESPQRSAESSRDDEMRIHARMFGRILPSLTAPGLVEIGRTWRPDVFLRESADYAAVVAAEHLGLPHAAVSCFASLQGAALFERNLAKELAPVCEEVGGPPAQRVAASLHRYLLFSFAPPLLAMRALPFEELPAIPDTAHFVRPRFFDGTASSAVPADIAPPRPQPRVHVTMGTEANGLPHVYPRIVQTIIDAARGESWSAIVTLGLRGEPADFTAAPNVRLHRYVPQSAVLPHCEAMVTHGGSNSLLAAIDAGLSVVTIPLIADQFFNAHLTEDLGLGRVIPAVELSPETIRNAVADVLSSSKYRVNVRRLQAEMHRLADMSVAVKLIERLAATREPLRHRLAVHRKRRHSGAFAPIERIRR